MWPSRYVFYLWDVAGKALPQFHCRELWYDLHLLKGEKATAPISYETELNWVNRAYKGTGVFTRKKTHAGRSNGARAAELRGVSESEIRRAGHWNTDAMTNCYLTNVPREFAKAMAGFDLRTPGNYYIPRARVPVPESLERVVWPWVDDWLRWFNGYDNLDPTFSCSRLPEVVTGVQLEAAAPAVRPGRSGRPGVSESAPAAAGHPPAGRCHPAIVVSAPSPLVQPSVRPGRLPGIRRGGAARTCADRAAVPGAPSASDADGGRSSAHPPWRPGWRA